MTTCPCCGQETLHSFVQESLIPGKRPARQYLECHNPDCATYMQTVSSEEHARLCEVAKTTRRLSS
jgi:hypothetical protein